MKILACVVYYTRRGVNPSTRIGQHYKVPTYTAVSKTKYCIFSFVIFNGTLNDTNHCEVFIH